MARVTHPTTGDVMTVPDSEEPRWVAAGWLPEEAAEVADDPAPAGLLGPWSVLDDEDTTPVD